MRHLSRDSWIAIGLFVLLILVTIAAAMQQTRDQTQPPLVSTSAAPDGAKALFLALAELGYKVDNTIPDPFYPPAEDGLIFMLEPFATITPTEWDILDNWVEKGGTLVVAGDNIGAIAAANHYHFTPVYLPTPPITVTTQTPLLTSPPATPVTLQTEAYFETVRSDFVTHLALPNGGPVLLSFEQGEGRVILCTAPFLFSNAGLKEAGNAALVLNILSAATRPGLVWFDEWHHGLRTIDSQISGPWDWLRYTPAGHALLYVVLIIFLALFLRGQLFGRPVPIPTDTPRRAPLEYITAIANLSRRAGHRSAVLSQYHQQLKRGLGHRYRLNPTLPDEIYLTQLAQLNPTLDIVALGQLLARLSQRQVSENELIQLASEVTPWLKES